MTLALESIRVLDLSHLPPGAYCTMILGDLGADVITIVPPNSPFHSSVGGEENKWEVYDALTRNKKSLFLNLREEDARQVFFRLAMKADIIVESFRPGVVKRLGIDYETVKKIKLTDHLLWHLWLWARWSL